MIHRLALRILPNLALAVTDDAVRKRKRWVMLVPGLVAFGLYRAVQALSPALEAGLVLALSGAVCAGTAIVTYRVGREAPLSALWREDGPRRLAWIVGWVGVVYGVQLSLLVLALCLLVTYDFRVHPSGPAMMAMIIASTSVARDGFELGVVRRLQADGKPILTFPDGAALRDLLRERPAELVRWGMVGAMVCALAAWSVSGLEGIGRAWRVQLLVVTLLAGSLGLIAYVSGHRPGWWGAVRQQVSRIELLRFWAWPGLWFAATYYLVLVGALVYPLTLRAFDPFLFAGMAGIVGAMMSAYGYYLGLRRNLEDRILQVVPDSLLRCPFVMGILSKSRPSAEEGAAPRGAVLERVKPEG